MSSIDFVLAHGGGQGGWIWSETVAALHQQAGGTLGQAVTLDVPGCGLKRGRDTSEIGVDAVVDELLGDVDAAGVREAVLVGHSQAGTLMPRLLAAGAGRFRRAVYLSCCAPAPGQTVGTMMGTGLHGEHPDEVGWPIPPDLSKALWRAMFCNDMDEAYAAAFLERLDKDAWPPACGGVETNWIYGQTPQIPATYVVCLQDRILTVPWQHRFAERFGARIVNIDAGHQAMNTRPQALAEILLAEARA